MQYRQLGRINLLVSEVGVGGAQFGLTNYMGRWDAFSEAAKRDTTATVNRAMQLGYNYFDTAPSYGDGRSEEMVRQALERHRKEITLATKVSRGSWTPGAIRRSVEDSLRRLRTDVIDVIQFHRGWYHQQDIDAILSEGGLDAFLELREQGKVRYLGFTAEGPSCGVEQLIATGAFDVMQIRYNLMSLHHRPRGDSCHKT